MMRTCYACQLTIENLRQGLPGNESLADRDSCLIWLDLKEPGSVIYICFGSLADFAPGQLHEIAMGLESSSSSFLWVVKKDPNSEAGKEKWLPEGIGIRVGVEEWTAFTEDNTAIGRETVELAVTRITSAGEEGEAMRCRSRELAAKAGASGQREGIVLTLI
ncbi:hypothetical protein MLD38_013779 [Melastoma candidum]|uniref:Uncharacterized protein n=1 Tax=Melastoma candidum TaxID=119954 RepID=A0ACB9RAA1_9MYRT|nr:hypothetical protein MLD38_013779 [Melastoma candidum]